MEISARGISMHYDDSGKVIRLFSGLDLDVPSGATLAITGESGVGKTTLLYILGGLECPVEGDVRVGNESFTDILRSGGDAASFRVGRIAFVFQFHQLLPEFTALENVAMPLLIMGVSQREANGQAGELLCKTGLGDRLDHRPGTMSGGEQQRVALARALAGSPGVLLADEPTGNLDRATGEEITSLLLELQREKKFTLIVVTHSLELASRMDRKVELRAGGLLR